MLANCLAVGIGGFIGSVLRYLIGLETVNLASNGAWGEALLYAIGTCVLCVIAALAGSMLARA